LIEQGLTFHQTHRVIALWNRLPATTTVLAQNLIH